jgi:hypothetical protein
VAPLPVAAPIQTVPSQKQMAASEPKPKPTFQPRVFSGYVFGLAAAMCYGSSPLMARRAFLHAPGASTVAGGCLAYTAATLSFSLNLLRPGSWQASGSVGDLDHPSYVSVNRRDGGEDGCTRRNRPRMAVARPAVPA